MVEQWPERVSKCLVKDVYCMFYMVTVAQFDEPWSSYVRKNTHLVLAVRYIQQLLSSLEVKALDL